LGIIAVSGAFHVLAGAGVDLDLLAGLDKEGHLHGHAGLDGDGLLDVVGGVAADALGGVHHQQRDARRQFHGDDLFVDEGDGDGGVLDEVVLGVPDDLGRDGDGLVGLRVGEDEVGLVHVAEVHLAGHHGDDLDLLGGAEADIGGLAGLDAAQGGLHKGAEVAGRAVLHIEHHRDIGVVLDRHAAAKVVSWNCHKIVCFVPPAFPEASR